MSEDFASEGQQTAVLGNVNFEQQAAFDLIARHLTEVTVEMFASYGIAVTPTDDTQSSRPPPSEASIMASMGYAGDEFRGSLVLVTSRGAIKSWLAAMGESADADVCDALGEFSNMLLGRLKSRLLPEGLTILLSTPTTATGVDLRLTRPTGLHQRRVFQGPDGGVEVVIGAMFEEGFSRKVPLQQEAAAEAGDMLLF